MIQIGNNRILGVLSSHRIASIALVLSLLSALYWLLVASDRYVSEAQIVIERTDAISVPALTFGALLSGAQNGERADQLLLRSYLLSTDSLVLLDKRLNLRAHYSDSSRDIVSRMWSKDEALEWFHTHFLSRTTVEYDDYSGVLIVKAQAYDAGVAQQIALGLVEEGERYMNELGHAMARDQVAFLERQVSEVAEKALRARQQLLAFQNTKGMLSPQALAETLLATVNRLEAQLIDLKARRTVMLGYLSPSAPGVVELELQIKAIERQIAEEQARLTSPKNATLNRTVEEYQRLELAAKFAEDTYKTALAALEKGRVDAVRTLKKIAVIQAPTLPQYPLEPRRFYNVSLFAILAFLAAGILHLVMAIIRDHRD
ncbi:MAG: chain-length determining protein [Betaproteobacteria bacterium]|jgi:capsular polysaccharide transport system permease protein|nr:chain-length determining protein [Betaproteobacteria bacterium]HNL20407.1 hypothetical protein [Rhodocyclaceae bacterium]